VESDFSRHVCGLAGMKPAVAILVFQAGGRFAQRTTARAAIGRAE
jgi:chromate transport protein ChrA